MHDYGKYLGVAMTEWSKVEMGPDPTRAYFWPAVNKRPTRLRPRYFLTRPEEIFFDTKDKIEKFDVFRGNCRNSNPNHKWLTRPEPQKIKPTRVKNFWPGPITSQKLLTECQNLKLCDHSPVVPTIFQPRMTKTSKRHPQLQQ